MKFIKQHDQRDCGAACLSMIASHYGLMYPLSKYRELTKTDQHGVNLHGLCDAAQKIGLKAEALCGCMDELLDGIQNGEIKFPFIAHITNEDNQQHFVVVFSISNRKLLVGDPAKGKVTYTLSRFAELWNGCIVTFEKTKRFQKGQHHKGGFRKFFTLLKGQYKKLTAVVMLSLMISLIGIVGAFVFEIIIDDFYTARETVVCEEGCTEDHGHVTEETAQEDQNDPNILYTAILFVYDHASDFHGFFIALIGLYILQALIQFVRGYLMSVVSKTIDLRLMLPYYDHIMDLPMSAVNMRSTGEYIARFSDASTIRTAVSGATLTLLLDSVMVIACGVILFLENAVLFLISLIMILLYAIVVVCYRKPIETINREVMEHNARVQSYLKESIDGIETVKSHRAEHIVKAKNDSKFTRLIHAVFKNSILSESQDAVCNAIEMIGTIVILWIGFGMVMGNVVTIGSLITFYALLAFFTQPIKNLIELQPMMQTAVVAAERLNDILDMETEHRSARAPKRLEWRHITFSDVDFRYSNHELTLDRLSLDIQKGECVAVVGESGCGKTTLAKLLMKFYAPERGCIRIDGEDLGELSVEEVRADVAYVDQSTFLFSDTVKNNLRLGNPDATQEEIETACRLAGVSEFISRLPFGYDSYLDENGKNLSGGQKQRLAIARALLRKPRLLILDEATCHLDAVSESAVKDSVFRLKDELTCLIIAHRLSTVRRCDRILVMESGTIVESGTHEELMAQKGRYFQLYSHQ